MYRNLTLAEVIIGKVTILQTSAGVVLVSLSKAVNILLIPRWKYRYFL